MGLPWNENTRPSLVGRFALASLVVLLAIGTGVSIITAHHVLAGREEAAAFHAQFMADAVLAPFLRPTDLESPLTGARFEEIDLFVRDHVLSDGQVVRIKVWRPDGMIVYSDDRELVGTVYADERVELHEVLEQGTHNEVSDLDEAENVAERAVADRLYESYVPLRLEGQTEPGAVAEFYQDYAPIEADVNRLVRTLSITFGAGLIVLYLALLPLALGASRALRRQRDKLEEQAGRLSELLAREQRSVAELEELNRMKSDFVAVASHELRSPLTAILGYAKILRRPEFDDDPVSRREFLGVMEAQGDRLFRLVENLLTTSRLENRELPLEITRFDLALLVQEVSDGLHAAGARVRLEIPSGLPPVETDRDRLAQVLGNLLDNALKYSPDESPVEVGAKRDNGQVVLWVRDHGSGIDPQERDRIFERFYQSDGSPIRRVGGVGLGLYLVKGLVASLGGSIELQSEIGNGSTFTIRLPIQPEGGHTSDGNGQAASAPDRRTVGARTA
jgi:signal transduction histidine kinase